MPHHRRDHLICKIKDALEWEMFLLGMAIGGLIMFLILYVIRE